MLATLDKTRADAKVMKKAIKTITGNFEGACKNTADLLHRLTNRATALEKLKAKVGLSKSLDAYLHLTEFQSEEEEEDELLKEGGKSRRCINFIVSKTKFNAKRQVSKVSFPLSSH